jgi:hypothetical protein
MTTRTDNQPLAKPGDKVVRMCPDNQLKAPVRRFDETFSAETVVLETYFSGK